MWKINRSLMFKLTTFPIMTCSLHVMLKTTREVQVFNRYFKIIVHDFPLQYFIILLVYKCLIYTIPFIIIILHCHTTRAIRPRYTKVLRVMYILRSLCDLDNMILFRHTTPFLLYILFLNVMKLKMDIHE